MTSMARQTEEHQDSFTMSYIFFNIWIKSNMIQIICPISIYIFTFDKLFKKERKNGYMIQSELDK